MVNWKESFIGAGKTVLFTMGFLILGAIIIIMGSIAGFTYDYSGLPRLNWIVIVPTYIIGFSLMILGNLTSTYKIFSEIIAKEVKLQTVGITGVSATAGKICPNCGTQNRTTTKFCRKCGTRIP